jgi:YD repeat-containing protein
VLPEGSNSEFAVPIVGLGGRGIGTSLSLFYNSRVWSRGNNAVAFDAIAGWPGPGFSLGFGRIVFDASQGGGNPTGAYLLIDPDGTRHYLGTGTWMEGGSFQTSDGTHISYNGNARYGGTLIYKSGTFVSITPVNNRLVPTQIYDTNGNIVQIAYRPECEGGLCGVYPPTSIDYITDTLGRLIQFQYDSSGKLTSITVPGFGGTAQNPITQTLVQFDYQTQSVSYNFSGLTVEHIGGNSIRLKHVYFPATNTGYYGELSIIRVM